MTLNSLLQRVMQVELGGLWPEASYAGPHHFRFPSFYFKMWEEKITTTRRLDHQEHISAYCISLVSRMEREKVLDSLHCSSDSTG